MTNKQLTKDKVFKKACDLAAVQPTMRQASKYLRKLGQAYSYSVGAFKEVREEEFVNQLAKDD